MRRIIDYMLVDLDAAAASGHPLRQLLAEGWELYRDPFWNGGNGGGYAPGPCQAVVRWEPEDGPWLIVNDHGRYVVTKRNGAYEIALAPEDP
jgi:hypothetical protein